MKRLVISSDEAKKRARSLIVPESRKIVVEIKSTSVNTSIDISNNPIAVYNKLCNDVIVYVKHHSKLNFENDNDSKQGDIISKYIRFTVDDELTGSVLHCMFELRLSDHLLPEEWHDYSLAQLLEVIDDYCDKTGDILEPVQFDYIVNGNKLSEYDSTLLEIQNGLNSLANTGEVPDTFLQYRGV